jgi:flagellar biosynthetic protein FlhB
MADNEKEQDRTEQATPFKLREARNRGQVAKSMELTAWFILLTAVAFVAIFGKSLMYKQLQIAAGLFSQAGEISLNTYSAMHLFVATSSYLFYTFSFLIFAVVAAGLLANFFQSGPVFSWAPLKADFSRINPITGFKKLFNVRIIYELVKVSLKLSMLIAIITLFLRTKLGLLASLAHMKINSHPAIILDQAIRFSFWLLAAFSLVAFFDFAFMKWEYAKNMRMSRRELKDEIKRREGDPKVKAKIRELQREAAKRGASLNRVADADVLITNPTHLSIAIRYERGQMPAPTVIAKGAGELALKMRIKARQCNVPVLENKPLARKLFERVRIDEPILPETYAQIAKILTRIYQAKTASS